MIFRQMVIHTDNTSLVSLLSCELLGDSALTSNISIHLFSSSIPAYEESELTRKPWSSWKVSLPTRAQVFPELLGLASCPATPSVKLFPTVVIHVGFKELLVFLLLLCVHMMCDGRHTWPRSICVETRGKSMMSTLYFHLEMGPGNRTQVA